MELPLFTESFHCRARRDGIGGLDCTSCRSSQSWRRLQSKNFRLPGDDVDFVCPHGKEWIYPEAEPLNIKLPGDWLGYMIKKLTGFSEEDALKVDDNTCGCRVFRRKMNGWGWMGCLRHRNEITQHMLSQAKRYGLIMEDDGIVVGFYKMLLGHGPPKELRNVNDN